MSLQYDIFIYFTEFYRSFRQPLITVLTNFSFLDVRSMQLKIQRCMMLSLDIVRRVLSWITDHFIRRRQQEVIHFKTLHGLEQDPLPLTVSGLLFLCVKMK